MSTPPPNHIDEVELVSRIDASSPPPPDGYVVDASGAPIGYVPHGSNGLGFQRTQVRFGDTYRDQSTVIIVPSRERFFHLRVVSAWQALIAPMNQPRAWLYAIGDEVGTAYNKTVDEILKHPVLGKFRYVMTLESDNLPPPDAQIRLIETIEAGKWDAVSGLYFTKGDINQPMCYGDPDEYRRTGVIRFEPRPVGLALAKGHVVECNGIAMGCSLYRTELFRQIPWPWFVTVADVVEGKGPMAFTQDLNFCQTALRLGKRFAVDMRVRVGHLDLVNGIEY